MAEWQFSIRKARRNYKDWYTGITIKKGEVYECCTHLEGKDKPFVYRTRLITSQFITEMSKKEDFYDGVPHDVIYTTFDDFPDVYMEICNKLGHHVLSLAFLKYRLENMTKEEKEFYRIKNQKNNGKNN